MGTRIFLLMEVRMQSKRAFQHLEPAFRFEEGRLKLLQFLCWHIPIGLSLFDLLERHKFSALIRL